MSVTLSNLPKAPRVPRSFFVDAAQAVLGKEYTLSVSFISPARMRTLNKRYRGKNTSTDILSFPLSKKSGEILFSLREVRAQAPLFERKPDNFLKFLFIHGLLHLKGYEHGATMEREERKFQKRFGI